MTDVKNVFTGKKKAKGYIIGGLAMMAMGLLMYIILQPPYGQSIGILGGALVPGLLMICAGLYSYYKEHDRPVYDERSARINAHAGFISWFLSYLLLGAMAWFTTIGVLQISFETIVWVVWIAMPWIFLIMRLIIGRRGEVA